MTKSSKGSSFEREFAVKLSLWWSEGEADDLFWRVPGSGGRATNRGKAGKQTAGGYGDILATDHRGQPLLDLCCFELKRGYNSVTVQDLLDKPAGANTFVAFLEQSRKAASLAGVPYWFLVHKRDRRETMIWSNLQVLRSSFPHIDIWSEEGMLYGCKLVDWLCGAYLREIRRLINENRSQRATDEVRSLRPRDL